MGLEDSGDKRDANSVLSILENSFFRSWWDQKGLLPTTLKKPNIKCSFGDMFPHEVL